jgi:hypothetical protein
MPIPNIRQIAAPYAAQVQIGYARGVPPAVNDRAATGAFRAAATGAFRAAAAAVLGPDAVLDTPRAWARGSRPRRRPGRLAGTGQSPPC